jgi:hypothetical protein
VTGTDPIYSIAGMEASRLAKRSLGAAVRRPAHCSTTLLIHRLTMLAALQELNLNRRKHEMKFMTKT